MKRNQLNIELSEADKKALIQRAKQEGVTMKAFITKLIEQDTSRQQGELIERQSLPLIRELVREELQKSRAELYLKLQDAMIHEIRDTLKEMLHKGDMRLYKLMNRLVRESGIIRRLLYFFVSKAVNPEFAEESYQHAMRLTIQELSERIAPVPPSSIEEQEIE